ncbi:odorant receptor 4-like isoform X2 [Nomia melanderi]|uniref:odorant receptor 4-like isoform X2 n=1 Tax=Nomia melanderi TaxID=2448451 RepID=UPI003FCD61BE
MSGKHTPDDLVKPAKNSNYAHDIDYALGWCRRMLRLIGVWSLIEQRTSWLEKVLSFLLRTVILGVQLFFIVPITLHICQTEKNPMMKIKLLGPPSNCAFSVIKFFYLVLRGTAFRSCIEHMENDWRRLQRKGNHTGRRLMHPGYDRFFDVRSSPVFELIYSAHCASGFFRFNVTAAAFTLAVIFVTHICGQMQIQMLRLRELCNRKDKETVRGQLSVIIHDHVEVLRFSKIARGAFIEIVLIEIFGSTFLLCLVEYCCLLEWKASNAIAMTTYTIYMTSFTFNAMIFCYIGEILTEQCSQIGFAGYDVDWYNLPGKRGCDFILLNMISLYPPKLSGGKIIELSLNTFSVILKTSVVYLNLLRTITTF